MFESLARFMARRPWTWWLWMSLGLGVGVFYQLVIAAVAVAWDLWTRWHHQWAHDWAEFFRAFGEQGRQQALASTEEPELVVCYLDSPEDLEEALATMGAACGGPPKKETIQ